MKHKCDNCGKELKRHLFCDDKCRFKYHNGSPTGDDVDDDDMEPIRTPKIHSAKLAIFSNKVEDLDVGVLAHKKGCGCDRCKPKKKK